MSLQAYKAGICPMCDGAGVVATKRVEREAWDLWNEAENAERADRCAALWRMEARERRRRNAIRWAMIVLAAVGFVFCAVAVWLNQP